jgi:hypothetical protein
MAGTTAGRFLSGATATEMCRHGRLISLSPCGRRRRSRPGYAPASADRCGRGRSRSGRGQLGVPLLRVPAPSSARVARKRRLRNSPPLSLRRIRPARAAHRQSRADTRIPHHIFSQTIERSPKGPLPDCRESPSAALRSLSRVGANKKLCNGRLSIGSVGTRICRDVFQKGSLAETSSQALFSCNSA